MSGDARLALSGLSAIADDYDGFIFDVWGTVYDGGQVFPDVVKVFEGLRQLKKRVVFLSNSPQLPSVVGERLARIGLKAAFHDGIVTSGGETHFQLSAGALPELSPFKGSVYLTGPDRFPDTLPQDGARITQSISDAGWILNAGPNHPPESLDDYEERLREGVARGLPMLCANPDKTVLQGGERLICAGALAERYADLGGAVVHIGKPHGLVFQRCAELLGIVDHQRILMVGDNLETDILGANRVGYHSLLVASGVHGLLDDERNVAFSELAKLETVFAARPEHVIDGLKW